MILERRNARAGCASWFLVAAFGVGLVTCQGAGLSGLHRISEHVYACEGQTNASPAGNSFGANAGVIVGQEAALVVDTLVSAKHARRFLEDIRKLTDKPIKYVVNTHYHLDHSWGNGVFVSQGAIVIAQERSREHRFDQAAVMRKISAYGLTTADLEGTVFRSPDLTFGDSLRIDLGGLVVELAYAGPSHTDDSLTVTVPSEKVVFAGDVLFTHYHPNLREGDLAGWFQALTRLEQSSAQKIIPGHGPVSTQSDVREMREYLERYDALAKELCVGKSAKDAPAIAQELLKRLPAQGRTELQMMVELNLSPRYLAPDQSK